MGTLNDWQIVDANNNATPPDGWPENTMDYSDVNDTGRAVQGTMKRYFADINGSLDAGGIADVYTLSLNESGYAAYFDGMIFACTIPVANATTTPTLDVNGIGAVNIVDRAGNALSIGELVTGGVYEFSHDGTNLRIAGSGGVAGLDTELQFNNAGVFGGTAGLTYNNGTDRLTIINPVNITVDMILAEQADHTAAPGAGIGLLWLRDDGILIFTNPSGVDTGIGTTGLTLPGGATTNLQYNDGGAFEGMAEFVFANAATTTPQFTITPLAGLTTGDMLLLSANLATFDGDLLHIFSDQVGSTGYLLRLTADCGGPAAMYINQQNNFPGLVIEQTFNTNLELICGGSTEWGIDINQNGFSGGAGIRIFGSEAGTTNIQSRIGDFNAGNNSGLQIIHEFGAQTLAPHMTLVPHPNVGSEPSSSAGQDGSFLVDDSQGFMWQKMVDDGGLSNAWWSHAVEKKFNRVLTTSGILHTMVSNMPTWVTEVIIIMANISTDGVSPIKVTIGPSGSPLLTGYAGRVIAHDASDVHTSITNSSGFFIGTVFTAATTFSGTMRFTWSDLTEIWNCEFAGKDSIGRVTFGAGSIDITGNVDTIELDTSAHTDNFDGGEFTVILRGAGRSSEVF